MLMFTFTKYSDIKTDKTGYEPIDGFEYDAESKTQHAEHL